MDSMGGMLTKGISCGPACCTLVVGFFRLKLSCTITPVLPGIQYDGGSRPYAPGEIANLYKPVASHLQPLNKGVLPFMRPYHPPVPLDKITIKVIFKRDKKEEMGEGVEEIDNAYTREFMVPKSRTKIIVRAFNFMNVTQEKIQVAINNFRNVVTKIKVTITRFRKKP